MYLINHKLFILIAYIVFKNLDYIIAENIYFYGGEKLN